MDWLTLLEEKAQLILELMLASLQTLALSSTSLHALWWLCYNNIASLHASIHVLCIMSCTGTDEKAIIAVICYVSNSQRQELKVKFQSMYGKVKLKFTISLKCHAEYL